MQEAQYYYNEALFEKALKACYSAEIEANILIIKAENEADIEKKIAYYKDALISISKFSDKEVLIAEQNKLQKILSELYKPINQEVSDAYRDKVRTVYKEKEEKNYLPWIISIALLLLWASWDLLRKWGKL